MALRVVYVGESLPGALNETREVVNQHDVVLDTKIDKPGGTATGNLLVHDGVTWTPTETRFFEGTVRPEGNFAAPVGSRYINKNGSQGAVEWVKRTGGDSNTGWMVLAGDTGTRNVSAQVSKGNNGVVHECRLQRVGHVVDFYIDMTIPGNASNPYLFYTMPPGFTPTGNRYGGLQDNKELASNGTAVFGNGNAQLYSPVGGKRDRWSGTWITNDAWPTSLPGSAL